MADQKISELTNLLGSNIEDGDEFVVVDSSASETKAITASELRTAIGNGDFTITGNLTVQGTTVTIDSASAQTVDLGDNDKIRLGDGDDLQIYHNGGNSIIADTGTGDLYVAGDNLRLTNAALSEIYARGYANGKFSLYYDNAEKLATTSTGIDVTGTVTADGLTVDKGSAGTLATFTDGVNSNFVVETASLITTVGNTGGSTALAFKSANTERMRIDSNGNVGIGTNAIASGGAGTTNLNVHTPSATSTYLKLSNTGTGNTASDGFDLSVDSSGNAYLINRENGFLGLYTNATERMRIKSDGNLQINGQLHFTDTGSLIARPTTNALSFNTNGSERIRIDSSGKVGIGTSSPSGSLAAGGLHVTDRIAVGAGSTGTPALHYDADTDTGIFFGTGVVAVSTGGTERMRIDSSGNVGIGVTPVVKLDVQDTSGIIGRIQSTSGDAQFNIAVPNVNDGILAFGDASAYRASIKANTSDALTFQTGSSLTERMRIDSSGNVGIGTTSPNASLSVTKQNSVLSGTGNSYGIHLYPTSSGQTFIDAITNSSGSTDLALRTYNNATYNELIKSSSGGTTTTFQTSGAERMRIDTSGNLLVGTTNTFPAGNNVAGTAIRPDGDISITKDGDIAIFANRKTSDGDIMQFRKDGTAVGSIGSVSDKIYIGSSAGGDTFLRLNSNTVAPASSSGADRDATINLGYSGARFQNLLLSGGVFLGGTGSSNQLSDYEEGTWTPTAGGTATISSSVGRYTKIGRLVTIEFEATYNSSGTAHLGGLPFAAASDCRDIGVAREDNSTGYIWQIVASPSGTNIDLYNYTNSSNVVSGYGVRGTLTYYTS